MAATRPPFRESIIVDVDKRIAFLGNDRIMYAAHQPDAPAIVHICKKWIDEEFYHKDQYQSAGGNVKRRQIDREDTLEAANGPFADAFRMAVSRGVFPCSG